MFQPRKKLKFLFVSEDKFPPFRVDSAVLFGKEMIGRGHSIDWILQSEAPCVEEYQALWSGCNVWVGATDPGTSIFHRLRKNILSFINDLKMFSLIRRNEYDFIQVKDKFISGLMAIVASKLNNSKFTYWLSYPLPEASIYEAKEGTARYPLLYFLRGIFFNFILYHMVMPGAHHIFVQSEQMKRDVVSMGIPEIKLTSVPMGVSLENILYNHAAPDFVRNKKEKIVAYLGTLKKVRKLDFLLRVFTKVLRELPDAKLYMIGGGDDPSDEQMLREEAKRLRLEDSVIFTGFLQMEEGWRYVKHADVCVSPFYPTPILNSTSPTKLIEYMAMGKPVVANDHPEQRLVISESNAGLCVPYNEEAFARAIIELLNDPSRAKEMGIRGKRYVEQYRSYTIIADIVEEAYLRLCEDGSKNGNSHNG